MLRTLPNQIYPNAATHKGFSPKETRELLAPIKIVLVNDHPVLREGLISLLAQFSHIQIVGHCNNISSAIQIVEDTHCDVLLTDSTMENSSPLELAQLVRQSDENIRIIFQLNKISEHNIRRAFKAGVSGFVVKEDTIYDIVKAINVVAQGEYFFSKELQHRSLVSSSIEASRNWKIIRH